MTAPTPFSDEMIQAFVAGTLDAEAAAELTRAAAADPALTADIALRRAIRLAGQDAAAQRQVDTVGWSRIARSIAIVEPLGSGAANDMTNGSEQPFWARRMIAPWQAAAALVIALVGWQTIIVPRTISTSPSADGEYALAGADQSTAFVLRVAFVDTASVAELHTLLRAVDARVIDGPSAVDLYDLAFANAEAQSVARRRLAQERNLVSEIAEP